MTDFAPQSTAQLPGDPNTFIAKEILRNSLTITPVAQSVGFALTGTASLDNLNTNNILPELEVWMDVSGGGVLAYMKCPFTIIDSSGNVSRAVWIDVSQGSSKGGGFRLQIDITLFDRNAATPRTFYYKVRSTQAGANSSGDSSHNWVYPAAT